MNWLKHILLTIALLTGALPCVHAQAHPGHSHEEQTAQQLCGSHCCACHSCESTACADDLDVEQQTVSISVKAAPPALVFVLYTHIETRPPARRIGPSVPTALTTLKTVQLLI